MRPRPARSPSPSARPGTCTWSNRTSSACRPASSAAGAQSCLVPLASAAESWSGRLPGRSISWELAAPHISRTAAGIEVARDEAQSPYHARFTQGATLVPRFLLMVEDAPASPIGVASGRREVRSMRSANEKLPWKELPALQGSIEQEFIRPVHLGATLLPFRLLEPWLGVIPWDGSTLLEGSDPRIDLYPGLAEWWTSAEAVWEANKGESHLTLLERIDYRNGLSLQFPVSRHRILYTKSGQYLAAARLDDPRVVVDHKLYWATAGSLEEAQYLTAILNSPALTKLVAPMQARGEHNPRDFDKQVWRLPIPLFDPEDEQHQAARRPCRPSGGDGRSGRCQRPPHLPGAASPHPRGTRPAGRRSGDRRDRARSPEGQFFHLKLPTREELDQAAET